MKIRHIFLIVAIVAIAIFLYSKKKKKSHVVDDESEIAEVETKSPLPKAQAALVASTDASTAVAAAPVVTPAYNEAAALKFSGHLDNMARCLSLANAQPHSEKVDPTPDALVGALRSSLGDSVVQLDDWSQVEGVEKNGDKKRIRVDYDYPDGATATRRLSMFSINSYGAPEIVNLTEDQINNPNEAYIESLKDGLKVTIEDRAARVYFAQGEELMFTIRNGKLQTFSMSRGDRYFNCSNLDQENSLCSCP